ncbi:hypothetical protein MKW98_031040 [Papaver atlanticum]|uniref:Uncharacterized protein n=1 Tax=Papaver atlanticum TaxID=357466 RepID=A0AAD4XMM6_9MAGN|nr:hypothetical protein MKW98_031040 [Papaver atlanticum]
MQHYVVYMGEHSYPDSDSVILSNHELLASVAGSIGQAEEATTHHYHKSFRGFSAFLTPKQAQKLRETESVISVFESKSAKLHTTHSWEFLGTDAIPQNNEQTKMDPKSDVIIGVFDTGVRPESQSFSDDGLGPVPERFKGTCGDQADGSAINSLQMDKYYGIIDATAGAADVNQSLDANLSKEKIVVCTAETKDFSMENRRTKGAVVNNGGGVGMILIDPFIGNELGIENVIPTTVLGSKEIEFLQEYLKTEKIPTAIIHPTETVISDTIPSPDMAFFSSKGPNIVATDIIKPDITAPGVNILASKPPPSGQGVAIYKFDSGTSMSCPHVSAVAAIIKSHHPSWSSSAIKSALMTTAYAMHKIGGEPILKNMKGSSTTPFDYGSGHINPAAALDPGLIYEYGTDDMINFLCSSTNQTKIPLLEANCPDTPVPTYDLNYPSIGVATMDGSITVNRTVTYYGEGPAIFDSEVDLDNPNVKFIVTPKQLEFKEAGENISFSVKFMADSTSPGSWVFGS